MGGWSLSRKRRAESEARSAARAAHLASLPTDVQPLVRDGWEERDARFAVMGDAERRRRRSLVRDGVVLFLAVEVLLGGFDPLRLALAALGGALCGLLWIPLVGRGLGLQLAAPLTAAPIFVGLRFATAESNRLIDFTLLCGVFMLAGIASWIGFQRDEELHGA